MDFVDLWMCGFVPKSTNPQILPPLQTAITQSIAYRFAWNFHSVVCVVGVPATVGVVGMVFVVGVVFVVICGRCGNTEIQ